MDDALVPSAKALGGRVPIVVLILVIMDDALVPTSVRFRRERGGCLS